MKWQKVSELEHSRFYDKDNSKYRMLRISFQHVNLSYGHGLYPQLELLTDNGWVKVLQITSKEPGEKEIKSVFDCEKELKEYAEFIYPNTEDKEPDILKNC
jgi:hypothetical protein